ncbi:MAG: diguanylate cyclase [Pseudomonadota bacterium]
MESPFTPLSAGDLERALDVFPQPMVVLEGETVLWVNQAMASLVGAIARPLALAALGLSAPTDRWWEIGNQRFAVSLAGIPASRGALWVLRELAPVAAPIRSIGSRAGPVDRESGTLGRLAISQSLQHEVTRTRRYRNPLAIALLHVVVPAGATSKEAISEGATSEGVGPDPQSGRVGRYLRERMRWADAVGRWGPDRYLLVLPETNASAAVSLITQLMDDLGNQFPDHRFAYGVALWQNGDDETRLLARAEIELEKGLKFESESTDGCSSTQF